MAVPRNGVGSNQYVSKPGSSARNTRADGNAIVAALGPEDERTAEPVRVPPVPSSMELAKRIETLSRQRQWWTGPVPTAVSALINECGPDPTTEQWEATCRAAAGLPTDEMGEALWQLMRIRPDGSTSEPILALGQAVVASFNAEHATRKAVMLPNLGDTTAPSEWAEAGFSNPAEVAAWQNAGIIDPNEAAAWDDARVLPTEVRHWKHAGCDAEDAAHGTSAGATPDDLPTFAAAASRTGVPVRELVCFGSGEVSERWAGWYHDRQITGDRKQVLRSVAGLRLVYSDDDIDRVLTANARDINPARDDAWFQRLMRYQARPVHQAG